MTSEELALKRLEEDAKGRAYGLERAPLATSLSRTGVIAVALDLSETENGLPTHEFIITVTT